MRIPPSASIAEKNNKKEGLSTFFLFCSVTQFLIDVIVKGFVVKISFKIVIDDLKQFVAGKSGGVLTRYMWSHIDIWDLP